MLRFLTAGESHGPAEIAIIEGIPAGLNLSARDIQPELEKRRGGSGRGGRGQIEADKVKILSGLHQDRTIGSPIALLVENLDCVNWKDKINIPVTNPRPGHADLAGVLKYGFDDARSVIERAAARETVMRVAVGAICKKFLKEFQIKIASHTIQLGNIRLNRLAMNFAEIENVHKRDPVTHCIDAKIAKEMQEAILKARIGKNTLGGIIEIIAHQVPPGLGSYVHYDRRLDGRLAGILMSIPSVKAIEIGEGITASSQFGSEVHDEIFFRKDKFFRKTNRAGGIEGGVSNGEDIILRIFHKPLATLGNPLNTIDIDTKRSVKANVERSDVCAIPRAGVISEASVAFILADAMIEKFGSDSLVAIKQNFKNYSRHL